MLWAEGGEDFRDHVDQPNRPVGLSHVIGCFADFPKDQGDRLTPSRIINRELEDCSENEEEMIDKRLYAFHEYDVRNFIWPWGLVGAKRADNLMDSRP